MKRKFLLIFLCTLGCASQSKRPAGADLAASPEKGILATLPFTLHDNRLLVEVMLNGQGPFLMIFDTGAASALTPEVQKLLELKSQGAEVTLAGEKEVSAHSVHLQTLQLGDYRLNDQKFLVLNLNPIRKTFRFSHLDGVIGSEILKQAKVRIDFDRQVVQILSEGAEPLSSARKLSFEWMGQKPVVQGKINGRSAKILIDTGDRSNLTLFRKYAVNNKFEKLFRHRGTMITGMGLGGPIPGKIASIDKIEMGSEAVTDVMTRLPMTKRGYFYSSAVSASAGLGLLKAFNLELDSKNKTVALQRRANYNEPSTFIPVR